MQQQQRSEPGSWNTVGKQHRKENLGRMANGGGRDARRDKGPGLGPRRAKQQDTRPLRPTSNVRANSLLLPSAPLVPS